MTNRGVGILALAFLCACALATDFNIADKILVEVNTVGPFVNPSETYGYYTLPFCRPRKGGRLTDDNLGASLAGDRTRTSLYDIRFRVPNSLVQLCQTKVLTQNDIKAFRKAIAQSYVFEMFVDDLPVKGFIGEVEVTPEHFPGGHVHNTTNYFLYTHLAFSIAYNGPNVIAVNVTADSRKRVNLEYGEDLEVEFTYDVTWSETHTKWIDRLNLHNRMWVSDQLLQIHWLSIINSFVLVLLLTAFTAMLLLRALKKDFSRYMAVDVEEPQGDDEEETGWKLVHGDVFRFPPYPLVFSALVGTGTQILALVLLLLLLAVFGLFYPGNRGALYTAGVVLYALTAYIAGYVSTSLYVSMGGDKWATCAVVTALVLALPLFLAFSILNSIAWSYESSQALPPSAIFILLFCWAVVTFPLTIVGAIRGRNNAGKFEAPCKTKVAPREIPPVPFYRSQFVQYFIAGFLPFSAIYIEVHYIFLSIYGHRIYTLFGILFIAFVMLLVVTAFLSIAIIYFQLVAEDYRWWWRSFFSGCSAGVFLYAYAVFYFFYRSQMGGLLQTSFFFGYTLVFSLAFGLMLGAVSFFVARKFVVYMYSSIKAE